jgi:hypothetical protein
VRGRAAQAGLRVQILVVDYRGAFERVTHDPRYRANLDWGAARPGHPEGTVRAHIAELERNLEACKPELTERDYWKLRLLIHTHDTFKAEAAPGVSITHPRSHASLARAFLASFCDDADLLKMVQYHDEGYALWQQLRRKGRYDEERFERLLAAIDDWDLFLRFAIVDGCTEGKSREPLQWLLDEVNERAPTRTSGEAIR